MIYHQLRHDMDERDKDNIKLQARIVALQKDAELLRRKLNVSEENASYGKDVEQIREKFKREMSHAKKTQWVSWSCNKIS